MKDTTVKHGLSRNRTPPISKMPTDSHAFGKTTCKSLHRWTTLLRRFSIPLEILVKGNCLPADEITIVETVYRWAVRNFQTDHELLQACLSDVVAIWIGEIAHDPREKALAEKILRLSARICSKQLLESIMVKYDYSLLRIGASVINHILQDSIESDNAEYVDRLMVHLSLKVVYQDDYKWVRYAALNDKHKVLRVLVNDMPLTPLTENHQYLILHALVTKKFEVFRVIHERIGMVYYERQREGHRCMHENTYVYSSDVKDQYYALTPEERESLPVMRFA